MSEYKLVPVEPTEEMIDAPRQFLLFYGSGTHDYAKMRSALELSSINKAAMPDFFWTEQGHITKAAAAIIVYSLMMAAAPAVTRQPGQAFTAEEVERAAFVNYRNHMSNPPADMAEPPNGGAA